MLLEKFLVSSFETWCKGRVSICYWVNLATLTFPGRIRILYRFTITFMADSPHKSFLFPLLTPVFSTAVRSEHTGFHHRLLQIGYNILRIFQPDTEAEETAADRTVYLASDKH